MFGDFGTHSSRCTTSFQLWGQIHTLCHKLQHLPLIFQERKITFCTFAFCAFASRQWTNLCLVWGVLLKGGMWWDYLKTGLKACIPWGQGMHSSSKWSAEVQSTVQPCENLGCEQSGGRRRWNECVCGEMFVFWNMFMVWGCYRAQVISLLW